MKKTLLLIAAMLILTACVSGERMVRIVETDANGSAFPVGSAEVGGVRVESTAKPLAGHVQIRYTGPRAVVEYESGGDQ